jgi:hypothetical protein
MHINVDRLTKILGAVRGNIITVAGTVVAVGTIAGVALKVDERRDSIDGSINQGFETINERLDRDSIQERHTQQMIADVWTEIYLLQDSMHDIYKEVDKIRDIDVAQSEAIEELINIYKNDPGLSKEQIDYFLEKLMEEFDVSVSGHFVPSVEQPLFHIGDPMFIPLDSF